MSISNAGMTDNISGQTSLPKPEESQEPAWELIDVGRYRPRRIRGSFRGRELG
jgi:hypothetical protein